MNQLIDLLFYSDYDCVGSPEQALFLLMLAFVIGQMIGWTYMWTHRVLSYSQTFTSSLVVLPVLVALMMMLMSGSVFIAFGLLAVFAVVRFRNVLKDTRDTYYVLWAIVEGMAVGTRQESTALIGAVGRRSDFLLPAAHAVRQPATVRRRAQPALCGRREPEHGAAAAQPQDPVGGLTEGRRRHGHVVPTAIA